MVPLLDVRAQYRGNKNEIDTATLAVLAGAQYVLGQYVDPSRIVVAGISR